MPSYTKTVWEDYPSTETPVNATNLNNIENGIETLYNNQTVVNDSYNTSTTETYSCNYVNNLKKVLWENSDTTANFAAQTITLSEPIENFRYYIVLFRHATDNTFLISNTSKVGYGMRVHADGWAMINHRDVTSISGTSCTFSDNKEFPTYGGNDRTANNRLIPFQIIGQY